MSIQGKLTRCLLLALMLLISLAARGADDRYLMREQTYKTLAAIQELIGKEEHQQALERTLKLIPELSGKDYEQAVAYQILGYIHSERGQHKLAAAAFLKALQMQALPEDVDHNLRYNAAQLLIYSGDYQQGLEQLRQWMTGEPKPGIDSLRLAATASYYLKHYKDAANYIDMAITQSQQPQENWYQLQLACYYELKHYAAATQVLEKLVKMRPSTKDYWLQLAAMYQQRKLDRRTLAIMELMQSRKMLKDEELVRLARLYLYLDMPYKAGSLLTDAIDRGDLKPDLKLWTLLADAWILAQEKGLASKALTKAAPLAPDGNLYARLGQTLVDLEQWQPAHTALREALDKDKLDKPVLTLLLFGISSYHIGARDQSWRAFQAVKNDKALRSQAEWWLRYLEQTAPP